MTSRSNSVRATTPTKTVKTTPPSTAKGRIPVLDMIMNSADNVGPKGSSPHDNMKQTDFSPAEPMDGEKPNDLLLRLYEMWPYQLTASYRTHVTPNPEASADYNLRYLRELYPTKSRRDVNKVRAAGVVVQTVCHMGKKGFFLKSSAESISLAAAVDKSRLCL